MNTVLKLRYCVYLLFLFLVCSAYGQINYSDYFTSEALRIDYLRTGNAAENTVKIEKIFREPTWSGCRSKTIDPHEYGNFKIEVTDAKTGKLLFGYNYSTLFSEYIFTESGLKDSAAFQETLRIPFPKNKISLTFSERLTKRNMWTEQFILEIDPVKIEKNSQHNTVSYTAKKLHDSGKPEQRADIVFVSEGYTAQQQEKFFSDAERISGYLLGCNPFSSNSGKINVWAVFTASSEEGVTDPSENKEKNTILKCNFSTFGTERYLMTERQFILRDIASFVPYDHIIIVVNTNKYGGGGIYNFYATCPSDEPTTDFLVIHEFGHSFTGLADEYWTSDVAVAGYYDLNAEPAEPNITTLVSFDTKWKVMVEKSVPVPTPPSAKYHNTVGVFEGAGYSEKGIYRPFYDCTMKSVKYDAFCPVCRKAIESTIDFYSE